MAQILTGRINLSKIPEALIKRNAAGEAFVWVDVAERREPSQYGDTHNISIYDSANRQKIYIGELRPRDIGGGTDARPSAYPATPPAADPIPSWTPQNNARAEAEPTPVSDDLPDLPF